MDSEVEYEYVWACDGAAGTVAARFTAGTGDPLTRSNALRTAASTAFCKVLCWGNGGLAAAVCRVFGTAGPGEVLPVMVAAADTAAV